MLSFLRLKTAILAVCVGSRWLHYISYCIPSCFIQIFILRFTCIPFQFTYHRFVCPEMHANAMHCVIDIKVSPTHKSYQNTNTVSSLYCGHPLAHKLLSSIAGIYFSQTSVIYFCRGFSCCPYYQGVRNSEVSARRELTAILSNMKS